MEDSKFAGAIILRYLQLSQICAERVLCEKILERGFLGLQHRFDKNNAVLALFPQLLLQRAVNDGEMSAELAAPEKAKVRLEGLASATTGSGWDDLPVQLRDLIEKSMGLQERIRRLDGAIGPDAPTAPIDNPVGRQLGQLAEAFKRR